eukprot:s4443_g2.t1
MDPSVAAMFGDSNKRKDLFNLWLTHARDFGKVTLEVARRNTQRQSAQSTTVTWSRAQLEQSGRYQPTDIDDLIQRAVAAGRYIDDPNFPGNERLRRYMIFDDVSLQNANVRGDFSQGLTPSLADVMPDGTTPAAAPGDGSKGSGKARGKAKAKAKSKGVGKGQDVGAPGSSEPNSGNGDGNAAEVEETTPLQKAKALAKLKEAEEARSTCVSIENLECSSELREALLQHATAMTEIYRNLSEMVADQINDESAYLPIFERATSFTNWYKARKKVANSMKAAASSAS